MTTWHVTTPTYPVAEYVEHMLAQVLDVTDYEMVEAPTRREAVSVAVKRWLAQKVYGGENYVQSRRSDRLCPFTGVRAQSDEELREQTKAAGPPDWEAEYCDATAEPCETRAARWIWVEEHHDTDLRWGWFGACPKHGGSA